MSVTSSQPDPSPSHSFLGVTTRVGVIVAALVIGGAVAATGPQKAQAALAPHLSAEQLGHDTLISQDPAPLSQAPTTEPTLQQPTISIANTPLNVVESASVASRSELGVPDPLKSDLEPDKPTAANPRQALPKKAAYKYILIDLSEQRVYAKEDGITVFTDLISSGLTGPTPVGQFKIYLRYYNTCMSGPDYHLCNIRRTQYFHGDYSIHEAWWHNNFGHPMSHGCVNMRFSTADWFWNWATYGTDVYVQH